MDATSSPPAPTATDGGSGPGVTGRGAPGLDGGNLAARANALFEAATDVALDYEEATYVAKTLNAKGKQVSA